MSMMPRLISGAMIEQLATVAPGLPALRPEPEPERETADATSLIPTARSYVSADRLRWVLRNRFGCVETPRRDPDATWWLAPDGRRLRVLNPLADPIGRSVIGADGRMGEVYTVFYARALLRVLIEG
jgi:hypothetical protein